MDKKKLTDLITYWKKFQSDQAPYLGSAPWVKLKQLLDFLGSLDQPEEQEMCPRCHGFGQIEQGGDTEECGVCQGTGEPQVEPEEPCETCGADICPECGQCRTQHNEDPVNNCPSKDELDDEHQKATRQPPQVEPKGGAGELDMPISFTEENFAFLNQNLRRSLRLHEGQQEEIDRLEARIAEQEKDYEQHVDSLKKQLVVAKKEIAAQSKALAGQFDVIVKAAKLKKQVAELEGEKKRLECSLKSEIAIRDSIKAELDALKGKE